MARKNGVTRRDFLKVTASGLAAAAVGGVLPGIALAAPRNQEAGVLRVAWGGAPSTLDPLTASADVEISFLNAVFDYLVDTDAQSAIVPRLATEWSVSDDGLTYTFQIVEGVKFHDGSDLTPADIVWTFERLRTPETATADLYANVDTVAAGEGSSVIFTLKATNPDFLYDLSDNHAVILKEGTETFDTSFNGTGPFKLDEYIVEDRAVFSANAEYWAGAPAASSLQFIYFADTEAAVNALRGGVVDVLLRLDNPTFLSLSGEGTFKTAQVATNQHEVIRLRADRAPGDNPLVREAFRLATDRQALYDRIQLGFGAVGRDTPIGPLYGAYYTEETPLPARDPAAAAAKLAEAGYPDGLDLTLYVPTAPGRVALAQALAAQWEEAGIRVTVEPQEESAYYADSGWLEVDLGITPWGSRPTPQFYLDTSLKTGAVWNESHFSDAELDALIDTAKTSLDEAERVEAYHEIQRILIERGPLIVPFYTAQFAVTGNYVGDLPLHPFPGRTNFNTTSV